MPNKRPKDLTFIPSNTVLDTDYLVVDRTGLDDARKVKKSDLLKEYSKTTDINSTINTHKNAVTIDHPDNSVTDNKIGNRTIDDPDSEDGTTTGSLTTLFNNIVNAIRSLKSTKVDKVDGKGLSTYDYSLADKNAVGDAVYEIEKIKYKGFLPCVRDEYGIPLPYTYEYIYNIEEGVYILNDSEVSSAFRLDNNGGIVEIKRFGTWQMVTFNGGYFNDTPSMMKTSVVYSSSSGYIPNDFWH